MIGSADAWAALSRDSEAEAVVASIPLEPGPGEARRLRTRWPADVAACAMELARARVKALDKWAAAIAGRLWADVPGVEMASSWAVAAYKARRFAGFDEVVDLCCGIGGDAMALAAGGRVLGVDRDPARAWMTGRNAGCDVRTAEVTGLDDPLPAAPAHLDPARRDEGGRRRLRYEQLEPGPKVIERIAARRVGLAVKLPPGVEARELPVGEVEWISEGGRLTQAVLWTGVLAGTAARRATRLGDGAVATLCGDGRTLAAVEDRVGAWVHAADPSVERSGLLGVLAEATGATTTHEHAGLLMSDEALDSPFLTAFEVVERLGWSRRRVASRLRALGAGVVEVKTRGRVIDADEEQRRLSAGARGPATHTVFVQRLLGRDAGVEAIVCRRAPAGRA